MSTLIEEYANKELTLITQESEKIKIPIKIAIQSKLIKSIIFSNDDQDFDDNNLEIPVINVTAPILRKVIEFLQYHFENGPMNEIEKPLRSKNLSESVSEWDANYINLENDLLFNIILAANYLDIQSLLDLSCAKVATMIKGLSPEEIRKTFNIENDFTPEEEEQIKEENKWTNYE
tara:strand:- start:83 stop:610 length:528 start_codon:yes stop_codon:yes gene_type:complete